MSKQKDSEISNLPMNDLFMIELEQHSGVLSKSLLSIERQGGSPEKWSAMMRAAHSIKGAARLVNRQAVAAVAHTLEDCLTIMQSQNKSATSDDVDLMLRAVDLMSQVATCLDDDTWLESNKDVFETLMGDLASHCLEQHQATIGEGWQDTPRQTLAVTLTPGRDERTLRVGARQLDKLMALAGEALVQARWVRPYSEALRKLKREQGTANFLAQELKEALHLSGADEKVMSRANELLQQLIVCRDMTDERVSSLEQFDVRLESLSSRLQSEVLASRMRPLRDIVSALPRLVRDLARTLGKSVELQIVGEDTLVDRDVLDKIEAPLTHLINNALDHGLEDEQTREHLGKPRLGLIELNAYHQGGMLYINISDDGRGLDFDAIRARIISKRLLKNEVANALSEAELTEFLFMPGFSTRDKVSTLSGRGIGLDVVRDSLIELRGSVEARNRDEGGTKFVLRLPLTLSVLPALLVVIGDESYAVPLARVQRILRLPVSEIEVHEGRRHARLNDALVPLVSAARVLDLNKRDTRTRVVSILVLGDREGSIGFVVGRFLAESELSVHVLPPQLGKIADISAAATMEDGTPALILDVDDFLKSGRRALMRDDSQGERDKEASGNKRILVVDDSITVRELERKLLVTAGYDVDVAVDGMDGWNAVRNHVYDLVVTDIDMPRLNGYQLVQMIKQDPLFKDLPVLVVSAKEKRSERALAIQAGASAFLGKTHFHDDSLRTVVEKLLNRR